MTRIPSRVKMDQHITLHNIQDGETVHQRSILVSGTVNDPSCSLVYVKTTDTAEQTIFPTQQWAGRDGRFKALLILSPGENVVRFLTDDNSHTLTIKVQYVPLMQTPPLHLVIMVAKDSPLLIDCPPHKFSFLTDAHSGLQAATAKLRTTAYMWQAFTAEEFRAAGLGRRSFRLEEEWAADTLSRDYAYETHMQSTAKVHLIRTDKTVAELRDAQMAQQNESGRRRDELHKIFTRALLDHGDPFISAAKPVVAGLIFDSHYDAKQDLILAHAALGSHNPNGLSLGIFGSHLTYSWPRFIEEVQACLTDTQSPGDRVGNDNGECNSMWEACCVGQGAFLHEVGHALSAPHTTGVMARGYSRHWARRFVEKETTDLVNACRWDFRDMLRFNSLPHFRHPGDVPLDKADPEIKIDDESDAQDVIITCKAGVAQMTFNGVVDSDGPSLNNVQHCIRLTFDDLESRFNLKEPLELEVVAMNGKHRTVDLSRLLSGRSFIRVPNTNIRLQKKSVGEFASRDNIWKWAVMLKKRNREGALTSACKIDVRVGCGLDGAEVYYRDGTKIPCGPRGQHGEDPYMGGHQAKKIALPRKVDVVKVAVSYYDNSCELQGLRIWLSNGKAIGTLNNAPNVKYLGESYMPYQ